MIDEKKLIEDIEKEFDGVCVYDVSPSQAVNDFVEIVDRQPEVGKWIPCSLAKPINRGNYLVTSKGSTWVAEWYNDTWWGIELETRWTDVKAWMPLPEPYKGETE